MAADGPTPQVVVVGVDGGGSKTAACCARADGASFDGARVSRGFAGSTNWNSVGQETARVNLSTSIAGSLAAFFADGGDAAGSSAAASSSSSSPPDAVDVDKVLAELGPRVARVTLCMSGVDRPADQSLVRGWVAALLPHLAADAEALIMVESDAVAALASGTEGALHGIVVISGTGMIAMGFRPGGDSAASSLRRARSGGWGPLLGDLGSGYDLGQRTIMAVLAAHDRRGPATALTAKLLDALKMEHPDELIPWAYGDEAAGEWKRFADLSRVTQDCAEDGDAVAKGIIDDAVTHLVRHVRTVAVRIGLTAAAAGDEDAVAAAAFKEEAGSSETASADSFRVVLAGGNLTCEAADGSARALRAALAERLRRDIPNCQPVTPAMEIDAAAAALAFNNTQKKTK